MIDQKKLDQIKREAYKQGFIDAASEWPVPEERNYSSINMFELHIIQLASWNAERYVSGKIKPFYVQQVGRAKRINKGGE